MVDRYLPNSRDPLYSGQSEDAKSLIQQKKESITNAAVTKKDVLAPDLAAQREQQSQFAYDSANMGNRDFAAVYGDTAMLERAGDRNATRIRDSTATISRSPVQAAKDGVRKMGQTVLGMSTGLAAMANNSQGIGAVDALQTVNSLTGNVVRGEGLLQASANALAARNKRQEERLGISAELLRGSEQLENMLNDGTSDVSRYNQTIVDERIGRAAASHKQAAEDAIASGSNHKLQTVKRIAQDTGSAFSETISNPTVMVDGIMGQLPTLALGAASRGMVTAEHLAARTALLGERQAIKAAMMSPSRAPKLTQEALRLNARNQLERANLASLVGASEGGDAYSSAATSVMSLSQKDMIQKYPDAGIEKRLAAGEKFSDIQEEISHKAGSIAFLIAAPTSALATKLAASFELRPFSTVTATGKKTAGARVGQAFSSTIGETAEEFTQSGAGQLASNIGQKAVGDKSIDTAEGVGTAAGTGAALGMGMAGSMQSIGLNAVAAQAITSGAKAVIKPTAEKVKEVMAARAESVQAKKTVAAAEKAAEARTNFGQDATTVSAQLAPAAPVVNADGSTTDVPAATPATPQAAVLQTPVSEDPLLDPESRKTNKTRVETLHDTLIALNQATKEGETLDGKNTNYEAMVLYSVKTARQLREYSAGLLDQANAMPEGEARSAVLAQHNQVEKLTNNPLVLESENIFAQHNPEVINKVLKDFEGKPDIAKYLATAEGAKASETLYESSVATPDNMTVEAIEIIEQSPMYQRLPKEEKARLTEVKEVARIRKEHWDRATTLGNKSADTVYQEIHQSNSDPARPSLNQHYRDINAAVRNRDLDSALEAMESLRHFAEHMLNKDAAFQQGLLDSIAQKGEPITLSFDMVTAEGKKTGGKAYAKEGVTETLVDAIHNDARTAVELYNTLAKAYPNMVKKGKDLPAQMTFTTRPNVSTQEATPAPIDTPAPVPTEGKVALPVTGKYTAKDQAKSDQANKFIGRGSENSSTTKYAQAWGVDANSGKYVSTDTVFVSAEGRRTGRAAPDFTEIQRAVDAGATIVTDNKANRERPYNLGEREVATYLTEQGYVDNNGTWAQAKQEAAPIETSAATEEAFTESAPVTEEVTPPAANTAPPIEDAFETPKITIRERFAGLLKDTDTFKNHFWNGFKHSPQSTGLMSRVDGGVQGVLDALLKAHKTGKTTHLMGLFLDRHRNVELDSEQVKALGTVFGQFTSTVIKQINTNLLRVTTTNSLISNEGVMRGRRQRNADNTFVKDEQDRVIQGGKIATLDQLIDGTTEPDFLNYPRNLGFSVTEVGRDEAGKPFIHINEEVGQAMALAAANWVMTNLDATPNFDMDELNARHPDGIATDLLNAYKTKFYSVDAATAIGNMIQQTLGVSANKDASSSITDNLFKSLGSEVLSALAQMGTLNLEQVDGTPIENEDGTSSYPGVGFISINKQARTNDGSARPAVHTKNKYLLDHVKDKLRRTGLLGMLLTPSDQTLPTYDKPSTRVPDRVRGTNQKTSHSQKEQVLKENAVPFWFNVSLVNLVENLGAYYLPLLGFKAINEDNALTLHPMDLPSVEGKNNGLLDALQSFREDIRVGLDEAAYQSGKAIEDVAIHYSHYPISNGRVMADGLSAKSDKQIRQLTSVVKAEMDLTGANEQHTTAYYLTLAQALGHKIEHHRVKATVAKIQEELQHPDMQKVFAGIQALQANPSEEAARAVANDIQAIQKENTMVELHALETHARFLATKDKSKFVSYLGFEIDGKTNGPFNALFHVGITNLDGHTLGMLARGGFILNKAFPLSLNMLGKSVKDTYTVVADGVSEGVNALLGKTDDPKFRRKLQAALYLNQLANNVGMRKGVTNILRALTKGSVMPMGYGSGAMGVIGQNAGDLIAAIYAELSRVTEANVGQASAMEAPAELRLAIETLTSHKWVNKEEHKDWSPTRPLDFSHPHKVIFLPEHFQAMKDNLMSLDKKGSEGGTNIDNVGGILASETNKELAPILETFKTLYTVSALQMGVFKYKYEQAYEKLRAQRVKEGAIAENHALSRNDEEVLVDSLRKYFPAYAMPYAQNTMAGEGISVGAREHGRQFVHNGTNQVSQGMSGGISSPVNVTGFEYPGVKAAALTIIGAGDSAMMNHDTLRNKYPALRVYDGKVVSPLHMLDEHLITNLSAKEALKFDLLGSVEASFAAITEQELLDVLDGMDSIQIKEWGKALKVPNLDEMSDTDIGDAIHLKFAGVDLQWRAEAVRKNKAYLFSQKHTMDQMAGPENPAHANYTSEEIAAGKAADADLVELGNVNVIPTSEATTSPAVSTVAPVSTNLVELLDNPELTMLDAAGLQEVMKSYAFGSKVAEFTYKQIQKLLPANLEVFIGTVEAIATKKDELYPSGVLAEDAIGVFYGHRIFITKASEETLVHELIHATTMGLVNQFFTQDGKKMLPSQRDAVAQLVRLKEQFMKIDVASVPESVQKALIAAQAEVAANTDARAINEFMAWTLSNESLSTELSSHAAPSVLKRLAKSVRDTVRKLLGLPKNTNMVNFMVEVMGSLHKLVRSETENTPFIGDSGLFQRVDTENQRLQLLMLDIARVVNEYNHRINNGTAVVKKDWIDGLNDDSAKVRADLEIAGFQFEGQEAEAFDAMHVLMASGMQLDSVDLTTMSEIRATVLEHIVVEDLMENRQANDQADRAQATEMLKVLNGETPIGVGSNPLAVFAALSLTNPLMEKAMERMSLRRTGIDKTDLNSRMYSGANTLMNLVSDRFAGLGKDTNLKDGMWELTTRLLKLQEKAAKMEAAKPTHLAMAEGKINGWQEQANTWLAEAETRMPANKWGKYLTLGSMAVRGGVLSDTQAQGNTETITKTLNQMGTWQPLIDLVSEWVGTTDETQGLNKYVTMTKYAVSRVRQNLRVEGPKVIKKFFKEPISKAAWGSFTTTIGRTNLQVLLKTNSMLAIAMLMEAEPMRDKLINELLKKLGSEGPMLAREAKLLAEFQTEVSEDAPRYRNAYNLAHTGSSVSTDKKVRNDRVGILDQLITLYAIDSLSDADRKSFVEIQKKDPEGVEKLISEMQGVKVGEDSKSNAYLQRHNRWDGFVPENADPRYNVVLANAETAKKLLLQGYEKVGDYIADALDPDASLAYYAIERIGGAATYTQGALQTVEGTIGGVDALTGRSLDPGMGTIITDRKVVASIRKQIAANPTAARRLVPIHNRSGGVIAYERTLDRKVVHKYTRPQEDLAESIGNWLGRQAEEALAAQFNPLIGKELVKRWVEDSAPGRLRDHEYVDISKTKDKAFKAAWDAMPKDTQKMLKDQFDGPVMVRKDMIRNSFGYRQISVADAFTGMNDMSSETRKFIINTAYSFLGPKAYNKLVLAERAIQGGVGTAKDIIVVRSGKVALINGIANMFQLAAAGVPILQIPRLMAKAGQEALIYMKNERRLTQIVIELKATQNSAARTKLELESKRLIAENSRLSIDPLIKAGELPTIAEGLSETDEYTLAGDFMKWLEAKSEKFPKGTMTAVKVAMISKDTAIYQGLNRFIQLGDFTAKKVMYDHVMRTQGMDQAQALQEVSETFVNYNLNAGRTRDYLESMGLTWFWNYKMRIQKIVLRQIRRNPLHTLLSMSGAETLGSDSLLTSSAPMTYWGYSMGPGMGLRAGELMLWNQLTN